MLCVSSRSWGEGGVGEAMLGFLEARQRFDAPWRLAVSIANLRPTLAVRPAHQKPACRPSPTAMAVIVPLPQNGSLRGLTPPARRAASPRAGQTAGKKSSTRRPVGGHYVGKVYAAHQRSQS